MKNIILLEDMLDENGVVMFKAGDLYPLVKNRHIVNQGGTAYKLEDIWVEYMILDTTPPDLPKFDKDKDVMWYG